MRILDRPTYGGLPARLASLHLLFFLAAVLVYGAWWKQAPLHLPDTNTYLAIADTLFGGELGFTPRYPIGLPLILRLVGDGRALFFLFLILHGVAIWSLAAALKTAGVRFALQAMFLVAAWLPHHAQISGFALSEPPSEFFVATGFSALVLGAWKGSRGTLVLSSLLFAAGALTKPALQAVVLPLALIVWLATRKRSGWKGVAAFATPFLIVILLYSGFSKMRYGYFGLSYATGVYLSTRTARFIEHAQIENQEVKQLLVRQRDKNLLGSPGPASLEVYWYIWDVMPEVKRVLGVDDIEFSNYMLGVNLALIADAPMEYVGEVAQTVGRYLMPYVTELTRAPAVKLVAYATHFLMLGVWSLAFLVMAGAGLLWLRARSSALESPQRLIAYWAGVCVIFYSLILSCGLDVGRPRQRNVTDLLILVTMIVGVETWLRPSEIGTAPFQNRAGERGEELRKDL